MRCVHRPCRVTASRQDLGARLFKLMLRGPLVKRAGMLRGPSPLPLSHRMGEGESYCGGRNPGRRSFLALPWAGMCHPFRVSESGRVASKDQN